MKKSDKNHDTELYATQVLEIMIEQAKYDGMRPECFLLDLAAFCIMNVAENTGNSATATANAITNNYNKLVEKGWETVPAETKH